MESSIPARAVTPSVGRRALLSGVAGLSVATALAGCQPGTTIPGGTTSTSAGEFVPPTHVPFTATQPDFPAKPGGIPAGYTRLPDPAPRVGKVPLPKTGPISMLLQGNAPTVPFEKNQFYRRLADDGGAEFTVNWGGGVQYRDKFQVLLASDDLPDLVMIDQVPQLPKLLESRFTDLTEFLSGDKVKEYPGLASIPPAVWQVPVLNGRLWGVSKARPAGEGKVMLTRGDLLEKAGVPAAPELDNGEDFLALLAELSDPKANRFAIGSDPAVWLVDLLLESYGAPNGWRNVDGRFVSEVESDEMKAALETAASIWQKGFLHPNSISQAANNKVWWDAGTTALYIDGVAGWGSHARAHPEWNVQGVAMPKWQGGGVARKHLADAGYPYYVAIRKQSSPDRVREILRFMDFISAPFGTEEWRTVNYGVEGVHVNYADGAAKTTQVSRDEAFSSIGYLGSQVSAQLFIPNGRETVQRQHDYLSAVMPEGERDASKGLYSESASSKGAIQQPKILDAVRETVQGRKPLSDWDAVVTEWRTQAGDAMREEYARAAQGAG